MVLRPTWSCLFILLLNTFASVSGNEIDKALQYRQNVPVGTGASPNSAAPTSMAASPAGTSPNDVTPSSLPSSAAASIPTSTIVDGQTTSSPTTTEASEQAGDTTTTDLISPTTADSQPSTVIGGQTPDSSRPTRPNNPPASSTIEQVILVTVTIGTSERISTQTTSRLVPVSTSSPSASSSPAINKEEGGSGKSGLDNSQKRIIIGVVVGIGGAILLGGIAVVTWRIWGRKRHNVDEDNDLVGSVPGSSGREHGEKTSSISGHSPFRSTLDQYHKPAGPVNTASNF
ncbi:MAG: hypothetical protein LQ342_003777 [Letrouitia transgressa]|nr:MAG: hypothetical protein LQ342_003777 [Letrouitia transgressa]